MQEPVPLPGGQPLQQKQQKQKKKKKKKRPRRPAVLLWAFRGTDHASQLTVQAGTVVQCIGEPRKGWVKAEKGPGGPRGWIPESYVRFLDKEERGSPGDPQHSVAPTPAAQPVSKASLVTRAASGAVGSGSGADRMGGPSSCWERLPLRWLSGLLELLRPGEQAPLRAVSQAWKQSIDEWMIDTRRRKHLESVAHHADSLPIGKMEEESSLSDSTDMDAAAKALSKRNTIVKELVDTEQAFVDSLTVLCSDYRDTMRAAGLVDATLCSSIFGPNLEMILNLNKELLRRLRAKWQEWDPSSSTVGDVFLYLGPFLKMYVEYARGYEASTALLERLREKGKIAAFLDTVQETNPRVKGLAVESYIIMPIQRVPRYILLVKDILKATPDTHPDHPLLSSCLSSLEEVASHLNKSLKVYEAAIQLAKIQASIARCPKLPAHSIPLMDAQLILKSVEDTGDQQHGLSGITSEKVRVVILTTCWLIASKNRFRKLFSLPETTARACEQEEADLLVDTPYATFVFSAPSKWERKDWLKAFQGACAQKREAASQGSQSNVLMRSMSLVVGTPVPEAMEALNSDIQALDQFLASLSALRRQTEDTGEVVETAAMAHDSAFRLVEMAEEMISGLEDAAQSVASGPLPIPKQCQVEWKQLLASIENSRAQVLEFRQLLDGVEQLDELQCRNFTKELKEVNELVDQMEAAGLRALIKDRRHKMRKYRAVFVGFQLVDWLLEAMNELVPDAEAAVALGQRLMDADLIHHVTDDHEFKNEDLFYRFRKDEERAEDAGPSVASLMLSCHVGRKGWAGLRKGAAKVSEGSFPPSSGYRKVYLLLRADTGALYMFGSHLASTPIRMLPLSNVQCGLTDLGPTKDGNKFCMSLAHPTYPTTLSFASSSDATSWVDALVAGGALLSEGDDGSVIPGPDELLGVPLLSIKGEQTSLAEVGARVLLICNVASACGLAGVNYKQLQQLQDDFQEDGLSVVAFPCNQFGAQEPGTNEEICVFAKRQGATFPVMAKVNVNGPHAHPLYKGLKSALPGHLGVKSIRWNFTKFLLVDGKPTLRKGPLTKPEALRASIVKHLKG